MYFYWFPRETSGEYWVLGLCGLKQLASEAQRSGVTYPESYCGGLCVQPSSVLSQAQLSPIPAWLCTCTLTRKPQEGWKRMPSKALDG